MGYIPYPHLFIIPGVPLALGGGGLIGAVVGTAIWIMRRVARREFGGIGRAAIGFVIGLIVIGLMTLIYPREPGLAQVSWTQEVLNWLMLGILLGALPGFMARPKGA